MEQFIAKIVRHKKIAPQYHVMAFKLPASLKKIRPGQFFEIKVNDLAVPLLRRPFGAHKIEKNLATILFKIVGPATAALARKNPGDTVDVIGPLGNGFDIGHGTRTPQNALLVAGGHGVAPLFALAEAILRMNRKNKVTVFIGGRNKEHIISAGEFKKIKCRVAIATDDGSCGTKGLVTDVLAGALSRQLRTADSDAIETRSTTIYACGPRPMLRSVAMTAKKYDTPCQVSMEETMGCGTGICMGCSIDTASGKKLVCKDGPVFDSREVIW